MWPNDKKYYINRRFIYLALDIFLYKLSFSLISYIVYLWFLIFQFGFQFCVCHFERLLVVLKVIRIRQYMYWLFLFIYHFFICDTETDFLDKISTYATKKISCGKIENNSVLRVLLACELLRFFSVSWPSNMFK